MNGEFLLELLCEEIPANALPSIREQLTEMFCQRARGGRLPGFHGPGGLHRAPHRRARRGPAVQCSRTARRRCSGLRFAPHSRTTARPTPAALGFAKGQGVSGGQPARGTGAQGRGRGGHPATARQADPRGVWARSASGSSPSCTCPRRCGGGAGSTRSCAPSTGSRRCSAREPSPRRFPCPSSASTPTAARSATGLQAPAASMSGA